MKKVLLTLVLLGVLITNAFCQTNPYWQQQVNYKIDVRLQDSEHTLDGFIKMDYFNNSPDTLNFIWIHLWPNAYKNDRTAFSDQLLENGTTKFYFSNDDQRGYINRLDFKINGNTVKTEDHPQHQDIIKLLLLQPLLPGKTIQIETPFHVKLPYVFSRGGHIENNYWISQWYPKPAVYDRKGWHPIPYLDQGEYYSEFGNYEVQITVPQNYVVAATGILQNDTIASYNPASAAGLKTLKYKQDNVHDFAWFADKRFVVESDSLRLPSGKIINCYSYFLPIHRDVWKNSIAMIKRAILSKSNWLGEYPYPIVSVVDGGTGGGMEYPTITLLESGGSERSLDMVINHEVGHNWFYGILATDERTYPWMDEGMNTYYDNRYALEQYGNTDAPLGKSFLSRNLMPSNPEKILMDELFRTKKDQPIETPSENFNEINYNLIAYSKTGDWMQHLEKILGKSVFDQGMQEYYRNWQFKHPYPEDFKQVMERVSNKDLSNEFSLLQKKGDLDASHTQKKDWRIAPFFSLKATDKHHYIFFAPAIGFNFYDKQMFGVALHNYTLPSTGLHFVAVPLYSTAVKQFNGIGRISYTWFPGTNGQKAELALSGESFTGNSFSDSTSTLHYLRFTKLVPSVKYVFALKNPRSTVTRFIQWKTFLISEQGLQFFRDTTLQTDFINYPYTSRYLNQLRFVLDNHRVLYPYRGILQLEQGEGFARLDFTGNYFFNYPKGGGLSLRFFAGKFFYLGSKTVYKQFSTDAYHLNMTGPKGYEDYTYSNYFVGRNEFDHYPSQQIMIRDGAFKVRTDYLSNKIGKTDNWLAAINLSSDIPKAINPLSLLPFKIPLKLFLDIGTYAEAWKKNAETGRFVYDGGLQLSLFKDIVTIYVPLVYSKVYANYFKSTLTEQRFLKNIAFSINVQDISLHKFIPQFAF